jgi:folylpolyglutamate synthase/dihydropteroate synthase
MRTLAGELKKQKVKNLVAVFGVMKDKDYSSMLRELSSSARTIIAVAPVQKRALPAGELYQAGKRAGISMLKGGSVASGIRKAVRMKKPKAVLVTGSHYVVGEALMAIQSENA